MKTEIMVEIVPLKFHHFGEIFQCLLTKDKIRTSPCESFQIDYKLMNQVVQNQVKQEDSTSL